MGSIQTRLVFVAAAIAYFAAVTSRSSLGVAAVSATDRFQINATTLAVLGVVQLATYALMQVPVGILVDRFGSRALILLGLGSMMIGQAAVSFAGTFMQAAAGRILVGFGDAFIFISVLRLVNSFYSGKQATRMQQLVTNLGQLGQAASAVPFAWLLHIAGWNLAFLSTVGLLALAGLLIAILVRSNSQNSHTVPSLSVSIANLKTNLLDPAVRMAFWTHFTIQSASSVFLLLWGWPFLVEAQGLDSKLASTMLSSFVIISFVTGPLVSSYCVRWPNRRSNLAYATILAVGFAWASVLLLPQPASVVHLWLLIVVLAVSGPVAMVSMDISRSFVAKDRLGTANGIVNVGGFSATFTMMFLIGLILDLVRRQLDLDTLYSFVGFRYAYLVQFAVLAVGSVFIARERRKIRLKLYERDGITIGPFWLALLNRLHSK